jgi:hypothetical protein
MPMTLQQTKDLADTIYNARELNMIVRQNNYVVEHGNYFQGLEIIEPIPADGNEERPDFARKPTDQEEGWTPADFPPRVPSSLRIDVYGGVVNGWVATLSFTYDGDLWTKTHGYRDMSYMSHDWQITEV